MRNRSDRETTSTAPENYPSAREKNGEPEHRFSCPGSVLRARPELHPLTRGLGEDFSLFFSRAAAWEVGTSPSGEAPEVLLRFPRSRILLSGWIREPEVIAGRAAWVRASVDEGTVHLLGFRPQYRGWSRRAFQTLMRAILLEGSFGGSGRP